MKRPFTDPHLNSLYQSFLAQMDELSLRLQEIASILDRVETFERKGLYSTEKASTMVS